MWSALTWSLPKLNRSFVPFWKWLPCRPCLVFIGLFLHTDDVLNISNTYNVFNISGHFQGGATHTAPVHCTKGETYHSSFSSILTDGFIRIFLRKNTKRMNAPSDLKPLTMQVRQAPIKLLGERESETRVRYLLGSVTFNPWHLQPYFSPPSSPARPLTPPLCQVQPEPHRRWRTCEGCHQGGEKRRRGDWKPPCFWLSCLPCPLPSTPLPPWHPPALSPVCCCVLSHVVGLVVDRSAFVSKSASF